LNKKLYWALIALFSVIFLVSAIFVGDYLIDSYRYKQQLDDLQNMHTQPTRPSVTLLQPTTGTMGTTNGITLPTLPTFTDPFNSVTKPENTEETAPNGMLMDMYELYQLNNDVVGFIYIKDTNINNPVLQRKSKKDYYLYRDFYGNEDRHGSVYVREVCDVFGPSDNVTIYGHNMADGTMFANLHKYKDKDFFNAHPVVYFDTLYERHTYQVVCIFRTSGTYGEGFPYHRYDDFKDEAEYNAFIKGVRKLAIFDSGISVNYGDKFICLSTCEEWPIKNGRLVLLAVRIA
jgi:sortase B